MQSTGARQDVWARPVSEVVGVAQQQATVQGLELTHSDALDGALGTDGHENGRLDGPSGAVAGEKYIANAGPARGALGQQVKAERRTRPHREEGIARCQIDGWCFFHCSLHNKQKPDS